MINKTVTIEDIYNLTKKYGVLPINVNTPKGYHKILACDITEPNAKKIEITTETGKFLICSTHHKILAESNRFVKAQNLNVFDKIHTTGGLEHISSIKYHSEQDDLYDIEVDKVHQYYSNGIVSHNSSIIDSLIFTLYDKTPRAFKGDHIINNRKDVFECQLMFEINNEVFGIKRIGKRKKNGDVKVDVNFWKELKNGERLNLTGEDRRDTNASIRSYVGTYEDFIMTALSSQNSNALFIDKSHSERKDLLIQFMGLNVFDKLFDAAHDESREIAGILKRFKKSDVTDQLLDVHTKLTEHVDRLAQLDAQKHAHEEDVATLTTEYQQHHAQKLPVPNVMGNWDILQETLITEERKLQTSHDSLATTQQNREHILNTLHELRGQYDAYDIPQLEHAVTTWKSLTATLEQTRHTIKLLQTQINEKLKFQSKLSGYTYNLSCDVCVENNKTVILDLHTVNTELQHLQLQKTHADELVQRLHAEITPLEEQKRQFDAAHTLQHTLQTTQQHLDTATTTITSAALKVQQIEEKIRQLTHDINTYKTHEKNIIHNQTIDTVLLLTQDRITKHTKELKVLEQTLRDVHGTVSVLRAKKEELHTKLSEAEALETTYDAFTYYMDAVGRDGVPYELMAKALPNIEAEINNILSQIVDFTITLNVDGKNINGKLNYDYDRIWPLENSSGMERFISDLAIRIALINASNLPKPNFLIADEGFGVLDAEHLGSVQTLLNVFKTHFDFICIVSHLDVMRDVADHLIEIKKDDGYSHVSV